MVNWSVLSAAAAYARFVRPLARDPAARANESRCQHAIPVSRLSILILAACAQSANPPTPESARIEIRLPLRKAQAYDRMFRAFREVGLNIASASASTGSLTTVPLPVGASGSRVSDPIMEPYSRKITYRGIVLAQNDTTDTTTIILLGTVRNANFGGPESKEESLHSQMKGSLHDAWHRLEMIADRLRGETPH
jgi:hypothetical protein